MPDARAPRAAQEQGRSEGAGVPLGQLRSVCWALGVPRAPLSPVASPGPRAHLLQLRLTLRHLDRLLHGLAVPAVPRALRRGRRQPQEGQRAGGPGGAGVVSVTVGSVGDCQGCVLPAPRSPKCPSWCLQPTSSSSPPTPRASLSPPLEGVSTSSSCWSRGAANTCTLCSRPQV